MKKDAKPRSRKKPATVEAPQNNATLPARTGGVRSLPTLMPWRNKDIESHLKSRDRVKVSRFLQETLPIAHYLTHTLPAEAVGRGIGLKSISANPDFKLRATKYFRKWAESEAIDLRKEMNLYQLQPLLLATILGDGEVFAQKVALDTPEAMSWKLSDSTKRRLQVQTFTRDQIGDFGKIKTGERWVDGIKLNGFDQAEAYRVLVERAERSQDFREVPAAFMKHLKHNIRLNQVHGTPWMFCGASDLLDALDMKAVRKHAAKVKSAFLGATVTGDGQIPEAMRHLMAKGESGSPAADNGQRFFEIFGGAVMIPLGDREDVRWFQAQEAMNYGQFLEELISPMVWTFGYPPEYIFSPKLTGPSQRAILSKVTRAHERMRALLHPFLKWLWEFVIGDAMTRGELREFAEVDDWSEVDFVADPDPTIDLGRDERADMERLHANAGTMEDYVERRTGGSGQAVRYARIDEKLDDIRYAKEQAAKLGIPEVLAMVRAIPPQELSAMSGALKTLGVDMGEAMGGAAAE